MTHHIYTGIKERWQAQSTREKKCTRTIIYLLLAAMAMVIYDLSEVLIDRSPNLQEAVEIYINGRTEYVQVSNAIVPKLKWKNSFKRKSVERRLENNMHSGHYYFEKGLSTNYIVSALKNGWQSPVNVTIAGTIRTKGEIAHAISKKVMADSAELVNCINNIYQILPDTYQVYWDESAESIVAKLQKEWNRFWNSEPDFVEGTNRDSIASRMGLSRKEVAIIASIVNQESNYVPEYGQIAGVYVNRLKCGMPLQADPTVKYAIGDFSLKRILNIHLTVDSPFNTYKYRGLPPEPICVPSIDAIDAVLNYSKDSYLYFCASPEFNGTHRFARTLSEHSRNAAEYRQALNRLERERASKSSK